LSASRFKIYGITPATQQTKTVMSVPDLVLDPGSGIQYPAGFRCLPRTAIRGSPE
jgi:hypothetical protein